MSRTPAPMQSLTLNLDKSSRTWAYQLISKIDTGGASQERVTCT